MVSVHFEKIVNTHINAPHGGVYTIAMSKSCIERLPSCYYGRKCNLMWPDCDIVAYQMCDSEGSFFLGHFFSLQYQYGMSNDYGRESNEALNSLHFKWK